MAETSAYARNERLLAVAWKRGTEASRGLPRARALQPRRAASSVLPATEHGACSLSPYVRERALGLFAELEIQWHAGVMGGPSNHLLDSQVQCINAVGRMVDDPDRLRRALGHCSTHPAVGDG